MENLLEFFHEVGKLKEVKRTGWEIKKIPNPESIADHSFRLAIMAMILCPKELNKEKVLEMALIHDLCEIITEDIATREHEEEQVMTNQEKLEAETNAMKEVLSRLPEKQAKKYFDLWEEVEHKKSKEGEFIKNLDRLELMFQVYEYQKNGRVNMDMEDFWRYSEKKIKLPLAKELYELLKAKRNQIND